MPSGYAKLGQEAGSLLSALMGGKDLYNYGASLQRKDNVALEKGMLDNAAKRRELSITGDDLARMAGVSPDAINILNTFERTGHYGVKPHMAEGFSGPEQGGYDYITQRPDTLTDKDADIIRTMRTALGLHQAGVPNDLYSSARDQMLEGRMRSGDLQPSQVRDWRSALKGSYAPTGSSTAPPTGWSTAEWEMFKRLGTGHAPAKFMETYNSLPPGPTRFAQALEAALAQFDENQIMQVLGLDPLLKADVLGMTGQQLGTYIRQKSGEARKALRGTPGGEESRIEYIYDPETGAYTPASK